MSYKLLAPDMGFGAPYHIRLMFIVADRIDELDTSESFALDFSKMSDGIVAACPDFIAAKTAGKLNANMDRMPVMVVDGVPIGQIAVIKKLLASRFDLYGATDLEAAQCDMVLFHLLDIKQDYNLTKKIGDDAVEKWFKVKLPEWMIKLEASITGSEFAVGSKISLGDIELYIFVKCFFDNLDAAAASIEACPQIKRSVKLVADLPSVATHLASLEK